MLRDENQVEEDADITKAELHRIAGDAAPICLQARVNDKLQDR